MYKKRVTRKKNKAYQKGYRFELRVKKYFEKKGYYVVRKYASKGAEDLLCVKARRCCENEMLSTVLLVQCKNLKTDRPLSLDERKALVALSKWTGGKPTLAKNVNHKLIVEPVYDPSLI